MTRKKPITKYGKFYIYSISDNMGEIVYIGSTSRPVEERWEEHQTALINGKHSNKTLQKKYFERGGNFEYDVLAEIPSDSDLLKFTMEFLYNSLYEPCTNKCLLQQGRKMIILPRLKDKKLAELILQTIIDYYKK